jgi:hypothetical protein
MELGATTFSGRVPRPSRAPSPLMCLSIRCGRGWRSLATGEPADTATTASAMPGGAAPSRSGPTGSNCAQRRHPHDPGLRLRRRRRRGRPLLRRAHSGRDHVMAPRRRAAGSAQPPADQPLARPVAHHAVSTVWIAPPDPGAFIVEPRRLLTIKARAEQATRPGLAHPPLSRKALIPGHHAVNPALLPPAATPISGRSVRASPPSDRSPLEQIFGVRRGRVHPDYLRVVTPRAYRD